MEDGFKLFSGGILKNYFKSTDTTFKAVGLELQQQQFYKVLLNLLLLFLFIC